MRRQGKDVASAQQRRHILALPEEDGVDAELACLPLERGALWARWGRVEVQGAPRRRAAGLAAAGMERLVLPMIDGEPGARNFVKR